MEVLIERITVPAYSTIGFGLGRTRDGAGVIFMGDARPMRELGEALLASPEPVLTEIPDDAIIAVIMGIAVPNDDESNGA